MIRHLESLKAFKSARHMIDIEGEIDTLSAMFRLWKSTINCFVFLILNAY